MMRKRKKKKKERKKEREKSDERECGGERERGDGADGWRRRNRVCACAGYS